MNLKCQLRFVEDITTTVAWQRRCLCSLSLVDVAQRAYIGRPTLEKASRQRYAVHSTYRKFKL